ncbi:ATP-dependent DNA helicase [Candidatus Woesearchaeota archaeon]|nr:ATP-dependent DNA helicase [Candidatus Woesearchaeota archaeon]
MKRFFFPFNKIRKEQDKLIEQVSQILEEKKHLVVNAPTGLGKTVSTLGPALKIALEKNFAVFFLTPRHTQHKIAIDTLNAIRKKYDLKFNAVDFIGKKWMCSVPGIETMYGGQFYDYCSSQREESKCEFYQNTKKGEGKLTVKAEQIVGDLAKEDVKHVEKIIEISRNENLCAYEICSALAKNAAVIICDYYHLLHPIIRAMFMRRTGKSLDKSILIFDEGHNVPDKVRELMSHKLSGFILNAAKKEAKKGGFKETFANLEKIEEVLAEISNNVNGEVLVEKNKFLELIEQKTGTEYNQLIADLAFIADEVKESKKQSFIGLVSKFMENWLGEDKAYVRILDKRDRKIELSYRCLDPSLITSEMINESYSTIIMSGTLNPAEMYKDLLGFPENTVLASYKSPFKKENQLTLIIPRTTTKFSERKEQQFKEMAKICSDIVNAIPGNSAVFFPSYFIRDKVNEYFLTLSKKTIFLEESGMNKAEKKDMLENFKKYKDVGAVLLGAVSGSFGEGIDLPGDLLKGVVIVGIPLKKPDLETQKLIAYYDEKFGKGWEYGYSLPAMQRCFQGAGRCIRSETDKGVIVFLDKRFTWDLYYKTFPTGWDIKITELYEKRVTEFFSN